MEIGSLRLECASRGRTCAAQAVSATTEDGEVSPSECPLASHLQDNAYLSRSGSRLTGIRRMAICPGARPPFPSPGCCSVPSPRCCSRSWHWQGAEPRLTTQAPSKAVANAAFEGSPPPLAALHAKANELIGGGAPAFNALRASLRGYPIVINKWASWCDPCQTEFPSFQRASVRYGKQVAFVGVNGKDHNQSAAGFLKQVPGQLSELHRPQREHRPHPAGGHVFPADDLHQSAGQDRLRPRRALSERERTRARHPSLCAQKSMTGVAAYEIRRVRDDGEMQAALQLRHDVFCVEQGVPSGRSSTVAISEGIHLVAVVDGELVATCRVLLVGTTAQFSRLAVRRSARRRGIATALLRLADEETRALGGASPCPARPDLRSGPV